VNVHEANENAKRDDVLNDKHLIAPTSNRCHRAEDNPNQYGPGDKTLPRNLIILEFVGDVVVSIPGREEIAHVYGCRHEHTSGAPSMQPVEALVADAGKVSDDVVLAGKKKDEWKLAKCHNSASKRNILFGEATCKIEPV
jgi:hypothetical protein